jgi:hypothetical protein
VRRVELQIQVLGTTVYLYDGHEVLSEFLLWGTILMIENDFA